MLNNSANCDFWFVFCRIKNKINYYYNYNYRERILRQSFVYNFQMFRSFDINYISLDLPHPDESNDSKFIQINWVRRCSV